VSDGRRHFTVAEAEALLPMVREVLADLRRQLRRLLALRDHCGLPADAPAWELGDRAVPPAYFSALERLSAGQATLAVQGVELKDADRGLVDFPALHEGRTVLLCWQDGEPGIGWFHETDDGFEGRRPLAELDPGSGGGSGEGQGTESDRNPS